MASKSADSLRYSDIADEPRRRLAPLEGYEDLELVSLQTATDPLVPIVKDIKHMVHNALADSEQIKSPLPLDQCASIVLYSMQWTSKETSFYHALNSMLRSPERDKALPPWLSFLKLFLTALAGLPTTGHRTVYRGVKLDLRDRYPLKSSTVWWGFSSCTITVSALTDEEFFGTSGTRTLFAIETDTGKDIHEFSNFPKEEEILLLPGRELKVIGYLNMGNGATMIQMREAPSPFPHLVPVPPCLAQPPKPVVKLSYSSRRLGDGEIERVMNEASWKECTELNLSWSDITEEGAAIIAAALCKNTVSVYLTAKLTRWRTLSRTISAPRSAFRRIAK